MLQDLQVNDERMNGGTGLMTYVAYHLLSAVSSLRVGGVGRGRPSFDICRDKRHGACIPIELLLLLLIIQAQPLIVNFDHDSQGLRQILQHLRKQLRVLTRSGILANNLHPVAERCNLVE